jgi:hypothetical protein
VIVMAKPVALKDLGIGKLKADLAALRAAKITIGYQGSSGAATHPDADASVATVAQWMEFGTPGSDDRNYDSPRSMIPSRPFLRVTFERAGGDFVEAARKALSDLVDGRATVEEVEARLGELGVSEVRKTIDDSRSWAEPLADSTVQAKGHDQPLLDSGTLRDSASWAVREGDTIRRQGGEAT